MKKVLVLCTGNSCRSQMAQGYLSQMLDGKAEIESAGIEAHGLNKIAVQVMKEDGIDISGHRSNKILEFDGQHFDYVITVCDHANEMCPVFPDATVKLHHNFTDPANANGTTDVVLNVYRNVRDEIKEYCNGFSTRYFEQASHASRH